MGENNNTNKQYYSEQVLSCLLEFCRRSNRPISDTAILAGLPVKDEGITLDTLTRAADRVGIDITPGKINPARSFSSIELPVISLSTDGAARLILENKNNSVLAWDPDTNTTTTHSSTEFQNQWSGEYLHIKTRYFFDEKLSKTEQARPHRWFWKAFSISWPIYSEVLLASLLVNLFTVVTPLFIMNVYDRVVPNQALETLWVLAIGVFLVFIFDLAVRTLRGFFLDVAGRRADIIMSSQLFERVIGVKMCDQPASTGALASNLHEFETLREFIASATLTTLIDLPFVILFLAIIASIGGVVSVVPLVAIPLIIAIAFLARYPMRQSVAQSFRAGSQKQAVLVESLSNAEVVKALGAESKVQGKWEQHVDMVAQSSLKTRLWSQLAFNAALFLQQFSVVGVVVIGVYSIANGSLTVGGLIACTMLTSRALAPLGQVAGLLTRYEQSVSALHALSRLMSIPLERKPVSQYLHREKIKGAVSFNGVRFRYPGASQFTLDGIDLTIADGERVGLVGRVGSGKTSLIKLILGLYSPTEGTISIDGRHIQQIDPAELRRHIGYVPQMPTLFYGTLRENITYARDAEDHEVLRVAKVSGVDEFASRHPEGYDSKLGERGTGLSNGQQQAVAIARALVGKPSLLVFDEPASAMDTGTEETLRNQLAKEIGQRTFILSTHRASMLNLVDRIIVIDAGKIVADGPKDQVLTALSSRRVHTAN